MNNYYDVKARYLINNWKKLSKKELIGLIKNVNWFNLCRSESLTIEFLTKFENYIIWRNIEDNPFLTQNIILHFYKSLNMSVIFSKYLIPESVIMDNISIFMDFIPVILEYQDINSDNKDTLKMLYELNK